MNMTAQQFGTPPAASTASPPSAVLTALDGQIHCYRALAKLVSRQHEHVQNDQTEELLTVLKEREVYLERLAALEAIVAPARRDWATFTATLSPADRTRSEIMMAEAKALLSEITSGDERDALALQQRKHRIGNEIKATSSAASVNRSYAASAYGRPRPASVDQRS